VAETARSPSLNLLHWLKKHAFFGPPCPLDLKWSAPTWSVDVRALFEALIDR
jgi:hypothetical protein